MAEPVATPALEPKERTVETNLTLWERQRTLLDKAAEDTGRNRSDVARRLLDVAFAAEGLK